MRKQLSLAELAARIDSGGLSDRQIRALRNDPRAGAKALLSRIKRARSRQSAESQRLAAMLEYEHRCWSRGVERVAGVDEVGAGPLAGPVVAAAVILAPGTNIDGVDDSKKLTKRERESLDAHIRATCVSFALGVCSVEEIAQLNILQASREAMRRAVCALQTPPEHLLVDARTVPQVAIPQDAVISGDAKSQSIAAASIVAKVARDAMMDSLAATYPAYGFERHKGYATAYHLQALRAHGPCAAHRRDFEPIKSMVRPDSTFEMVQVGLFGDAYDRHGSRAQTHHHAKPE